MAEIRVRDVDPAIIKQLEEIAKELHQATITGTLLKLFPKYHDMKKRIAEQNTEIAKLSHDLRDKEYKLNNARYQLEEFQRTVKNFRIMVIQSEKVIDSKVKQFGTKNKKAPARPGPPGSKNVPKAKPSVKQKRKK